MIQLTDQQRRCVVMASRGHNFTICGRAGTGKSRVIEEICFALGIDGKKSQVVCSTGIACEVFKGKKIYPVPITIHSFLGIGIAEGSFQNIIEKSVENDVVIQRVTQTDCCIWDECSMGSARLLELFHAITSKIRGNDSPFGGLQVILVGDWLQLKPVPSKFDMGRQMFFSPVFPFLFPHTIKLDVIHRQDRSEERFLSILEDLRRGWCTPGTAHAIDHLTRPIESVHEKDVVHLFYKNIYVDTHNALELAKLPGERQLFTGKLSGNVVGMKYPSPQMLYCKEGAPVICTYNVNSRIHNGTRGYFVAKTSTGEAIINVDGGKYTIREVTWFNVNNEGITIGAFSQIPLNLNWACTIHKAQGLQLPAICLHSSFEFTGGLIYTAMSRVKSIGNVQVVDFDPRHIMNRDSELDEINIQMPMKQFAEDGSGCCALSIHHLNECSDTDNKIEINNIAVRCLEEEQHCEDGDGLDATTEEKLEDEVRECLEELAKENNLDNNDLDDHDVTSINATIVDLIETMATGEHKLCYPPDDFDYEQFFGCLTDTSGLRYGSFSKEKNKLIQLAIEHMDMSIAMVRLAWFQIYSFIKDILGRNKKEAKFTTTITKNWYSRTMNLTENHDFRFALRKFLDRIQHQVHDNIEFSVSEHSLGANILEGIFHNLLNILAMSVPDATTEPSCSINVDEMDDQGKGKIRYLGGYLASELMKACRRYTSKNLNSENEVVLKNVEKEKKKLMILDNIIVVPYEILYKETKYPETLNVTEGRQHRSRGLMHISDEFFEFCIVLEKERLCCLTTRMFQRHGENVVEVARTGMINNVKLLEVWNKQFEKARVETFIKEELFKDIIKKYLDVGTKQFLKNFRLDYKVKKTNAHRQMVLMRKEKKETKAGKISIQEANEDKSQGKCITHRKLQAFLTKYGTTALCSVYTRIELMTLCKAFAVVLKSRMKKAEIGEKLSNKISRLQCIPYPYMLIDDTNIRVEPSLGANSDQGVSIRIVWAHNV